LKGNHNRPVGFQPFHFLKKSNSGVGGSNLRGNVRDRVGLNGFFFNFKGLLL